MSSTAIQAVPGGNPAYQNNSPSFMFGALSSDVDMITIFPEYLGVPFDDFASGPNLPPDHPWAVQMTALAAAAKSTGKPLIVETVLTRDVIVAKAVNSNGSLVIEPGWAPSCLDFTAPAYSGLGPAYVNYVTWIARTFAPTYFVFMVEANLYYVHCGGSTPSWQALVTTEQNAYAAVKQVNPAILAFPSFKLEDLYGQQLTGFDQAQYNAMSPLLRDRLGLATYPYGVQLSSGVFANPYQLPPDYLTRIRNQNPTEPPIVITETGWNSDSLSVTSNSQCYANFLYSDPSFEGAFLNFVIYYSYAGHLDGVVWWSDRNLEGEQVMSTCYPQSSPPSFPECNGDIWCAAVEQARASAPFGWSPAFAELAFKAFGSMGLRTYSGTAKFSLLAVWQWYLALPQSR